MAKSKISVDRLEYEALCEMRDVSFENMRLKLERLQMQYAELNDVNKMQSERLARVICERDYFRDEAARLKKYEPLTSSIPQPAFAKK